MLNNIMYYLVLQDLQAQIRNAGGDILLRKDDNYNHGELCYADLPAQLQYNLATMAIENARAILKQNPEYFIKRRHEQCRYIDASYREITLVCFNFFDGREKVECLCEVSPIIQQ